ncbi:MAG: hypothetical protein ABSE06_18375 [Anaerolineaceae bacterium]
MPLAPASFWDRQPKRTPERFRRPPLGKPVTKDASLPAHHRKKHPVTVPLPKVILVRRLKKEASTALTAL